MKRTNFEFIFPLFALGLLIFAASIQMFSVPPIGKILNPFIGGIQNEKKTSDFLTAVKFVKGLKQPVSVFFDNREVPHIYAKNNADLYYTQGFVSAYFRLWQMDFISYASAGRLSEILGDGFLQSDRNQRRIGILEAAKNSLRLIERDEETNKVLTAYTNGVNAFIETMDYKSMPLEYKILDYKPEPWSKLKTVLIMKYMGNMLSGYDEDVNMTNLMLTLGQHDFNRYFPSFPSQTNPIVRDRNKAINQELIMTPRPGYLDFSFMNNRTVLNPGNYNPKLGSNSWVVSGRKTKSGYPILCNDPHLGLSLPAIWIEMQLTSPQLNVYGVSIPGTPAIIIGFNQNIAWGITNGGDDVKNWFKLRVSGDTHKYSYNGQWHQLESRIEEIKIKNKGIFKDTVLRTAFGPIVNDKSFPGTDSDTQYYAMQWELEIPSNEILTFIKLNSAKNFSEYKDAIKSYSCPVQNFTFACKDNTIAVNHQGKLRKKSISEGKFVMDGTSSINNAKNYIPQDSLPQAVNPREDYLVSANQRPTGASYKYYYNGYFAETRALEINELLAKENKFTIDKMRSVQLNNTSFFAVQSIPILTSTLPKHSLDKFQKKMLDSLQGWNGSFDLNNRTAGLYFLWWKYIKEDTWDEFRNFSFKSRFPDDYVLLNLIKNDPRNHYFDDQLTSKKENAVDIILSAYVKAINNYHEELQKGDVKWGTHNKVTIRHLLKISEFGINGMSSAGCPEAINAVSGDWGPSWRMIVELGKRPKAIGIFPGGQSGNINDPGYSAFTADWNKGKYYNLNFYISEKEAQKQSKSSLKLINK